MNFLNSWLFSIFAVSILLAVADDLMPPGSIKKFGKFTCGLVLIITILHPIIEWGWPDISYSFDNYTQSLSERQQELEEENTDSLSALIETETEAYILNKAEELGIVCEVSVNSAIGEDGIPYPASAELSVSENAALSEYMSQSLGIGKDSQVWNTKKGSDENEG